MEPLSKNIAKQKTSKLKGQSIEEALTSFAVEESFVSDARFYMAAKAFLKDGLGIEVEANNPGVPLPRYFDDVTFNYSYVESALQKIKTIMPMEDVDSAMLKKKKNDNETISDRYDNIKVFACEAKQELERADIANLSRAFNRVNSVDSEEEHNQPVLVLVREGHYLHISTCQRTPHKDNQDSIGKAVVLHSIDMIKPLAGHIQILNGMKKSIKDCKTFEQLFEKICNSLSIDIMGEKFFEGYKAIYKKIVNYAVGNNQIKEEFNTFNDPAKAIRDYVKMLMGRIVFIQFLQKKGWMGVPAEENNWEGGDPEFLQNLFENSDDKDHFVSKMLIPLFQDLNEFRKNDRVRFIDKDIKVPYLNGGLFDTDEFSGIKFNLSQELMKKMLDFFRSYNFTIDENSQDSIEVGVDPEMLSRIFENLLEDNKEKGAFYTPKEVVEYMCREALTTYLQNGTDDDAKKELYKAFLKEHNIDSLSKDDIKYLDEKLRGVKICDPAIGSGAFPMGMLKELFECRKAIEQHLNESSWSASEIKKDIIQNSIYGVDIEKGAVNIARLRFWLALIIDEKTPHALPNMDFKIMQGNSLLEQFEGIDLSKLELTPPKKKKKGRKNKADDLQQEIVFNPNIALSNIQKTIKQYYALDKHETKVSLRNFINTNVEEYITHFEGCTPSIQKKIKALGIPNDQFFLWHIYFKEVFDNGGFDIVIGNPPYIELQKLGEVNSVYKTCGFKTYNSFGDIYCLFTEQGFNLLKEGGTLCYIMMNKWMTAEYGKQLRNFILNHKIHLIVDYGDLQVFKGATTYPCIVLLENNTPEENFKAVRLRTTDLNTVPELSNTFKMEDLNDDENWMLKSRTDLILYKRLKKEFPPLRNWEYLDYPSNSGIKTGIKDVFVVPTDVRNKIIESCPSAKEVIHPFFHGKDIKPYEHSEPVRYLILFKKGETLKMMGKSEATEEEAWQYICERYPSIGEWLSPHKESARERSDQGDYWWELRACSYYDQFDMPKIMYQSVSVKNNFIYDTRKMLCNNSMFIMPTNNKALLGLFNSKLGWWLISSFCSMVQGGFQLMWEYFNHIPIALTNGEKEAEISQFVNKILDAKEIDNNADISNELHEIDCRLYEIYGLTNAEVKVIDQDEPTFGDDFEPYQRIVPDEKIDKVYEELSKRFSKICRWKEKDSQGVQIIREYDLSRSDRPDKEELEDAFSKWSCAILTAYRGKNESVNILRNNELKERMRTDGMLFRSVDGWYIEYGEDGTEDRRPVNELSFIVTDTDFGGKERIEEEDKKTFFKKIYRLAEHYEQDSFLFTFPGKNRVAFLVATNDGGRKDFRGDIKFAGPLYKDLEDFKGWTGCENGKIAFTLKGMIIKRIPVKASVVKIGEGDIFDIDTDSRYNPDHIVVFHDNNTESLTNSCKDYQQSHNNLTEWVFDENQLTAVTVRSKIIEILDALPQETQCIGFHCSASVRGSYEEGARIAFDTVQEWAKNNKTLKKIVIVDIFGDYYNL